MALRRPTVRSRSAPPYATRRRGSFPAPGGSHADQVAVSPGSHPAPWELLRAPTLRERALGGRGYLFFDRPGLRALVAFVGEGTRFSGIIRCPRQPQSFI